MIEFKDWDPSQTEGKYLQGSKIAYVPLGDGAYGLIIVTPWQYVHLEEIPPYGGFSRYDCLWHGTVEGAIEFMKKEWI